MKIHNQQFPLLEKLISLEGVFWFNPNLKEYQAGLDQVPLKFEDVMDAEDQFSPFCSIHRQGVS
jgi:D-serine dehydratase